MTNNYPVYHNMLIEKVKKFLIIRPSGFLIIRPNRSVWNKTLNHCLSANFKKNIFAKYYLNFLDFFLFSVFLHKKLWKGIFWPALGVSSTQTLVKIYSKYDSLNCDFILRKTFIKIYGTFFQIFTLFCPILVESNKRTGGGSYNSTFHQARICSHYTTSHDIRLKYRYSTWGRVEY